MFSSGSEGVKMLSVDNLGVHWFPKLLAGLFVLFVLLGIHGSSVGEWARVFKSKGDPSSFASLGVSRGIRVDDWCVSQPFVFAQCKSKDFFPRFNKSVNGGMDMFLQTPCAPVWDWTVLGQVHNWGYFIFGENRGTSWSWWIRYLGLPFFAYFFLLIWCRGDCALSIVGALAIMFGAPTQWWDTTIPYHLLYFFFILVMVQVVSGAERVSGIILGGIGLLMGVLSYVFVMYPPFEILLLPVLLVLIVFVVRNCYVHAHTWWRSAVFMVVLLGVTAVICYFYQVHREVLEIIANSAYPGDRVCRGGSFSYLSQRFMLDLVSLFTWGKGTTPDWLNQCQAAEYCSMFIPALLAFAWLSVKKREVDGYEMAFVLIALVYVAWLSMDWPAALAKFTGFYLLPTPRVSVIQGFVVLLLSLRLFAKLSESRFRFGLLAWIALAVGFVFCRCFALSAVVGLWRFVNASGCAMLRFEVAMLLSVAIWMSFIGGKKRIFIGLLVVNSLLTGMFVHPIVNGLSPLYDAKIAKVVSKIDAGKPGTWWSNDRVIGQVPLALGLRCLAGTQQYCDRAYWQVVDPSGRHERVWNRYGHRFAVDFCGKQVFENRGRPDCIYHGISAAQLKELGVNYVIWRGAELHHNEMKPIAKVGSDTVYEVVYP